ncbi:hypothetical protein [Saccharopolyspora tripterygii]
MCNPDANALSGMPATGDHVATGDVPLVDHGERIIITAHRFPENVNDGEVSVSVLHADGVATSGVLDPAEARRVAYALLDAADLADGVGRR